jgi:pSer/pThr/pTyr-binding forkhead associated (FHA) protein
MRISVRLNGETVSEYHFGIGRVLIGRSPKNDICISSKYISLQHAELVCTPAECLIRDLNSTNGVFVHGDRVKEYNLRDQDVIKLERFELVYTDLRKAGNEIPNEQSGNEDEDSAVRKTLA